MVQSTNAPFAEPNGNRFEILDALRGFALLGVLLANILGFCGWYRPEPGAAGGADERDWRHGLELPAPRLRRRPVLQPFFAHVRHRLRSDPGAIEPTRRHRSADHLPSPTLGAAGHRHGASLPDLGGDILVLYSLLGFVLVACRNLSDRALLIGAAGLVLFPILGYAIGLGDAGFRSTLPLYDLGMYLDTGIQSGAFKAVEPGTTPARGLQFAFIEWTPARAAFPLRLACWKAGACRR